MCLHSIGFSYLRESHALARPSQGRCHSASAPAESRRSGAHAGLASHHAQDPAPSGQSLNDVGLFVGFAWHWFGRAPSRCHLRPLPGTHAKCFANSPVFVISAPVTPTRRIIDNCAHPAYRDALHRCWKRRRWDLSGMICAVGLQARDSEWMSGSVGSEPPPRGEMRAERFSIRRYALSRARPAPGFFLDKRLGRKSRSPCRISWRLTR